MEFEAVWDRFGIELVSIWLYMVVSDGIWLYVAEYCYIRLHMILYMAIGGCIAAAAAAAQHDYTFNFSETCAFHPQLA